MKHTNGFIYLGHDFFCALAHGAFSVQVQIHRRYSERDKRFETYNSARTMVSIGIAQPNTLDPVEREYYYAIDAKNDKHAAKLYPRILRRIDWIENHNRAYLAGLTSEQALAAFESYQETGCHGGSFGCLAWYECLPPGITEQVACNAAATGFYHDKGWHQEGKRQVQRGAFYQPGEKKQGTMSVAKRV